jgi:predicted DNA-binding ribbon-helix-helix protein
MQNQNTSKQPRKSVTIANGTILHRAYIYLPEHIWTALEQLAAVQNTAISEVINSLVETNTKDQHDTSTRPRNA